ncbi:MAG: hypothetical protein IJN34_06395 [Clostridia bacterium]|nr:hypothetical protein [Clostridia bacterium]
MKYQIHKTITPACIDAMGNIRPRAVLALFQDAAGTHAEALGVGFEALLKKNLLWVVTQIRYRVLKPIGEEQEITVETWPLPPNRLGFERCYRLLDAQGKLLIEGTSNWVVMDTQTRKMAAAGDLYPPMEFCLDKTFEDRARRIKDFEAAAAACTITPDPSLIDGNGHVNNTHYASFAETALGGHQAIIRAFQIDFLHEVLQGQPLSLFCAKEENSALVKGEAADGTRMFACSFLYE